MPSNLGAEPRGPGSDCKSFSCLPCRQRKVKCDRHSPSCSNCMKSARACIYTAPTRGTRKRTKMPREGLHAKLKRYEELLKSYGAELEPSEDLGSAATSPRDVEMVEDTKRRSKGREDPFGLEVTDPKLVTKDGTSRYFDSTLWSNLGDEFRHLEVEGLADTMDESNIHESGLFFEPVKKKHHFEALASFYPSLEVLPRLKEIYADRVDPLLKILHLPTFWAALTDAMQHHQEISKSFEALTLAFCLVTFNSLKDDEVQRLFGIPKLTMCSRYRLATRQALINAEFLSTSSPMVLRAYAMFMMSGRNRYDCDTLHILSGVAVRLARKMGLHRDGTSLGLSPFETEMRRRLWWHLVHVDFKTADALGTRPSLDIVSGDTKMPLNVQDEDLNPDMVEFPPERCGITSITLCLTRCEIMETLHEFSSAYSGDVRWEALYSPNVTLAKRDSVISQIEDRLERKILRYCDPSSTHHTLVSIMVRSAICQMKLLAHNPRQFANSSATVPQSECDVVFTNATKLLEYVTLMRGGDHGLEKYAWQMGTSFLWNTLLYLLIEVRRRKTGPEVTRAWQLIGVVFSHFSSESVESTGGVYTALGKWTVDVWDEHVAASNNDGIPEPSTPEYIAAIRRCQKPVREPPSRARDLLSESGSLSRDWFNPSNKNESYREHGKPTDLGSLEFSDLPDLPSFEMNPNEWVQWDQLIAECGGFAPGANM